MNSLHFRTQKIFFMKIQKNNNIFYETERLWKRTSPYQFLELLRAFKASVYFLHFCRNTFENAHSKNMYFDDVQSESHIFVRSHLANRLRLHLYYVERAVNRQPGYRSADSQSRRNLQKKTFINHATFEISNTLFRCEVLRTKRYTYLLHFTKKTFL